MESDENIRPWSFTVVKTSGLHYMRQEKVWRPIVTIDVDKHYYYETTLGSDGQNVNLKDVLLLEDVNVHSRVEIRVWYRSQSKKKGKKRNLVASASHSLGELLKKQQSEPKLEVRLNCQSPAKRCISSRGKPQNGAIIHLKVIAPPSTIVPMGDFPEELSSETDESSRASTSMPPSPTSDTWPDHDLHPDQSLRHRPIRPYSLDSDEDDIPPDYVSEHDKLAEREDTYPPDECDSSERNMTTMGWLAATFLPPELPQYTVKVEVPPRLSWPERALSTFTLYAELKDASVQSDFERIFARYQYEWTYLAGILVALAAVDTAVFSISPDSVFTVIPFARSAIATSSITSGLGISCDVWFLLRYNWASVNVFIERAKDVYGSYFFFALSARVPLICMFLSAVSLMTFLGLVAYDAWPMGVLVTCFLVGVIMSLQFLVYGAHWCVTKVSAGGRASSRGVVTAVRRLTG